MTAQALAMLKSVGAQQGDSNPTADMFSGTGSQERRATMGVTFVSGEPIKTADKEGYRARYSFTDITKVRVDMQQGTPAVTVGRRREAAAVRLRHHRCGASSSVLTIQDAGEGPAAVRFPACRRHRRREGAGGSRR